MLSTRIYDLPTKRRDRAHGDAAILAKDGALCQGSVDTEVHFELIVPESVFEATMTKPTSCTLSTKSGDTRRAVLVFY
jgi:hypothetical protein